MTDDQPTMEAYIFDLFGTLITVENKTWNALWDTHFESYHRVYVPRVREYISTRDFASEEETLDAILSHLEMEFTEEQREAFLSDLEKWKSKTKVAKGARKLLQHLKDSGYKVALISNMAQFGEDMLERHDLTKYFDVIVLSHKAGMLKPQKGIYESALEQLGVVPENAFMVGDSIDKDHLDPRRLLGVQSAVYDPDNQYPGYQHRVASWKEFRERYVK